MATTATAENKMREKMCVRRKLGTTSAKGKGQTQNMAYINFKKGGAGEEIILRDLQGFPSYFLSYKTPKNKKNLCRNKRNLNLKKCQVT
jgi:hypothetical protein